MIAPPLAATIYILAVLAANLTATWFIPLPLFGQVAVGTFIFGLTFTQRDIMHKHGRRLVYRAIAIAAGLSLLESLILNVPARIILASFTAIVLAEAADTEIFQSLRHRSWPLKIVSSNAVSIPWDTVLFNTIAFLSVFPWRQLIAIMWDEIVVKTLTGLAVGLLVWRQECRWESSL